MNIILRFPCPRASARGQPPGAGDTELAGHRRLPTKTVSRNLFHRLSAVPGRPAAPPRLAICAPLLLLILCASPADLFGQGAMTNGFTHQGLIAPAADSDSWTLSASIGDSLVVRVGAITQ